MSNVYSFSAFFTHQTLKRDVLSHLPSFLNRSHEFVFDEKALLVFFDERFHFLFLSYIPPGDLSFRPRFVDFLQQRKNTPFESSGLWVVDGSFSMSPEYAKQCISSLQEDLTEQNITQTLHRIRKEIKSLST